MTTLKSAVIRFPSMNLGTPISILFTNRFGIPPSTNLIVTLAVLLLSFDPVILLPESAIMVKVTLLVNQPDIWDLLESKGIVNRRLVASFAPRPFTVFVEV